MRIRASLAVLLLAACSSEPSFIDRYSDAAGNLENQAQEIDRQLNATDGNSAELRPANEVRR